MIKLFSGEDTLESYIAANKEVNELSKTYGFDIKVLNADEIKNKEQFSNEIEGVGMFSTEYIIFAKRLIKNKELLKFLTENIERFNNYHIVIWVDENADGKLKLVKDLKKSGNLFSFNLPKEWQINKWIEKISKAKNVNLNNDQINYLVERLGVNKWVILNEINKIKLFIDSKADKKVSINDLEKILGFDASGDIWKFLDFFGLKQKKEMFEEFEKITRYESNIQYLIAMINRELNLISKVLFAKENGIETKSLGLHPFVLQKTIKKASNFTFTETKALIKKLFDLDFSIKRGDVDELEGLSIYLMNI